MHSLLGQTDLSRVQPVSMQYWGQSRSFAICLLACERVAPPASTRCGTGVVSKSKRRYQLDGFDLDLAYINCEPQLDCRLLAMAFPSEGREGKRRARLRPPTLRVTVPPMSELVLLFALHDRAS